MTKNQLLEVGETIAEAIINALVLVAAVGIGVQFNSWVTGLSAGLGLLFLQNINYRLGKLLRAAST